MRHLEHDAGNPIAVGDGDAVDHGPGEIQLPAERVTGGAEPGAIEGGRRGVPLLHDRHFDGVAIRLHRREPLVRRPVECGGGGNRNGLGPRRRPVTDHERGADGEIAEAGEVQGTVHRSSIYETPTAPDRAQRHIPTLRPDGYTAIRLYGYTAIPPISS